DLNHSASHQAPTLIGCLIVKERYCKFGTTNCLLLPADPASAARLSLCVACCFQQQRGEIMKKFLSLVKSASFAFAPPLSCLRPLSGPLPLAAIETSEPPIRVNPKFSATAKPETITRLLQIMQPALA
ncbi:hypothetical protein, partial [Achromobacter sp. AGC39]